MSRVVVYQPDGGPGPGRLAEARMDAIAVWPAELVLPEVTVRDERGGDLFGDGKTSFEPAAGGGPFAGAEADRQARGFGVANTAFHAQRALRFAGDLLGRPLPHLLVRIGMHEAPGRWGGGHYRLPAPCYAELAESGPVCATGEVHLGGGRRFVSSPEGPYFHAPAHNPAIVYHEVGHHLCRHTADFRLNRLRPAQRQSNRKTAVEEGTADLLTAVLLRTPDIYGWHRGSVPDRDQWRRTLDARWTMAHFRGGHRQDPHADGTVWASACWSARQRVASTGADPARFDTMLVRGLVILGRDRPAAKSEEALRERRQFSRLLAEMVQADPGLATPVLAAFEEHGIWLGTSNAELRRAARAMTGRPVLT